MISAAGHRLRSSGLLIGISLCRANTILERHRSASSARSPSATSNVTAPRQPRSGLCQHCTRAADSGNDAEAALLVYCPVEAWRPRWVAGGARRVPGCGRRRHLDHGRFYVHRARLRLDILNSLRAPLRAPLRAQPDLPLTAHKTLHASLVGGI